MKNSASERNPFDRVAEEFALRVRRGERPPLAEYIEKHPELADEIRRAFPAIVMMERLKPEGGKSSLAEPDLARAGLGRRAVPERLGDFHILRFVAEGGMGYVFEAFQESMGRRVALKVLKPQILSQRHLARFLRESKAPGRLHHTNIIPIFGIGESDGLHFYAMQYIHGESLERVIADLRRLRDAGRGGVSPPTEDAHRATLAAISRSLYTGEFGAAGSTDDDTDPGEIHQPADPEPPPDERAGSDPGSSASRTGLDQTSGRPFYKSAARVAEQAARALAHAHKNGILHRDIKPANVLLDLQGTTWVADFGLAHEADAEDLSRGDVVGTLRFIPPERFHRQSLPQGDIYSLGLTLYELLTLEPAFRASDPGRLIRMIEHEQPRAPRAIDRSIPRDLETIVLKAIDKDPARRYKTADDLAEDLLAFREDREIRGRRARPHERLARWCRRRPAVAALSACSFLLLLTVAVVTSVMSVKLGNALGESRQRFREEQGSRLEAHLAEARARRYSRHAGQRFASLEALKEATALARALNKPPAVFDELRNEAIASLAVVDFRPLVSWTYRPSGKRAVFDQALATCASYVDDRGTIAVQSTRDGSVLHRLEGFSQEFACLRLSPDGRFLGTWIHHRLKVWRLSPGLPRLVYDDAAELAFLAVGPWIIGLFSPDSRRMILTRIQDGSLRVYGLETGRLERSIPLGEFTEFCAFHPGGRLVAVGLRNRIQVWDIESGQRVGREFGHQGARRPQAWSPDGSMLASTTDGDDVMLWTMPGGEPLHRLRHAGGGTAVAFDPSGEILASSSQWNGSLRLWHARTGKLLLSDFRFCCSDVFTATGRLVDVDRRGLIEVAAAREYRTLATGARDEPHYWHPAMDPSDRLLAVAENTGLGLWDPAGGTKLASLPITKTMTPFFDDSGGLWTYNGAGLLRWPVRLGSDGTLRLGPPERLATSPDADHDLWGAGSRDGRVLAIAIGDGAVLVHRDRPGRAVWLGPQDSCRQVAVSPDGRYAATSLWVNRDVTLWDALSDKRLKTFPGEGHFGFTTDGRHVLAQGRLWRTGSWDEGPAIRPDGGDAVEGGGLLATGSGHVVSLVDPADGRVLARLEDPNQDRSDARTFSTDGTRLITTNHESGTIHIWDLRLIRRRLAELQLDWDAPPFPPETPRAGPPPLRVAVDYGSMEPILDDPQRLLTRYGVAIAFRPLDAEAFYRRAIVRTRLGQQDQALADARIAAAIAPNDRRAHFLIGRTQYKLGQLPDCVAALRRAIASPARPDAFPIELADASLLNEVAWQCVADSATLHAPAEALPLILAAMEILPLPMYRNTLGVVYYRLGRYRDAIACFERNLDESQRAVLPVDLYFLAMSYHRAGDAAKARACFERGVKNQAALGVTPPQLAELNFYRAEAERTLGSR